MEKRYECLGLQGITENESLKEYVADCFGYAVPGYGCNYLHRGFEDYIEFLYCMNGNESKPEPVGLDMHFSSNSHWTVWFDTALDTDSTAHKYLVRKSAEGKVLLPIRVLCPDVLARLQPGDEMYGQVVAYVKKGTIHKADPEESGAVYAVDGDAVSVSGKICDINSRNFCFENYECDFLELDVDTEMGLITVLTKAEVLNAEPEIDDYFSATTYISMDVAVPSKRSRKMQSAFYEEIEYPNFPGDDEEISYENGFEPNSTNAAKVLLAGIEKKDLFRLGRCCADYVQLHDGDDIKLFERWDLVDALADLLEDSVNAEEILNIVDADGTPYPGSGGIVVNDGQKILVLDADENGFVCAVTILSGEQFDTSNDRSLYLIRVLAEALCEGKIQQLQDVMALDCIYRSDSSGQKEYGIRAVMGHISGVSEQLNDDSRYTYEICPARDELRKAELEDLPGIYGGQWCLRLYQGPDKKLDAIVFVLSNDSGEIKNIHLSRNGNYLKAFETKQASPVDKENYQRVDDLLEQRFGAENTVSEMRKNYIAMADDDNIYVWQRADQYIQGWFQDNSYRVNSTAIFEDCIGYSCTRRGVEYAVYVYAYGKRRTTMLDGDYCAKLRDYNLSKGRTILVIYLHVTAEKNEDGETTFFVGMYGSKDKAPEVWELSWIGEQSSILFYPRKEMMDLVRRLMAAFNAQRLDILQSILSDNCSVEFLEGGRGLNGAVYGALTNLRENHGVMKTAFVRFNDVVYSEAPYIEDHCYINFSVNSQDKIDKVELRPLDESYQELIVTDEVLMSHPMDEIPMLKDVEFLSDAYSMRLTFENGEIRRYDVPGDLGSKDVIKWRDATFTDKIFRNGRIADPISVEQKWLCRKYAQNYQGIEFINGAYISAVELYHDSYPVGEFKYRDGTEIFILQDYDEEDFGVGHIRGLDPSDPMYLFDKKNKIAKTLPAQYQETPVYCYPFCGGFSEGLLMVSTMGELDLQYHHNRSSCAGMWGWLDSDLNTVIEPKYVYAMNFWNGRAVVCKGEWTTVEKKGKLQYWCENEGWGVIDQQDREIVPCRFDELYEIEGTDRLYFVHEGGWDNGHFAIFDVQEQKVILNLDFDFDMGYMFNECFVADGDILVFMDHLPGKGEDLIYAYDLHDKKFVAYAESYTERTLNGESRVVVNKDGQDIIVF